MTTIHEAAGRRPSIQIAPFKTFTEDELAKAIFSSALHIGNKVFVLEAEAHCRSDPYRQGIGILRTVVSTTILSKKRGVSSACVPDDTNSSPLPGKGSDPLGGTTPSMYTGDLTSTTVKPTRSAR